MAEKLRHEFGDLPEVFRLYAGVAKGADMKNAMRLAEKIIASSAPAETTAEAGAILNRQLLIGRRLNGKLTSLDGKTVDFEKGIRNPTLIYVWPISHPDLLRGIAAAKKVLPANAQIVYFSPGATEAQLRDIKKQPPIKGAFCYQPAGQSRSFAEQLQLQHAPYVFVLNGSGAVVGYGAARELPGLLPLIRQ